MRLRALLIACVASGATLATTGTAAAAPAYAPADRATIRPGVQTFVEGAQCTANFIFTDGTKVFVGSAAHCAGTGEATDTDGCKAGSLPLGTRARVTGATKPATLVYSSWLAMQRVGERSANACQFNDFALLQLDRADVRRTNPSVPFWGGPTGLGADTALGSKVLSFGNSSLRGGVDLLKPKEGLSLGEDGGGWNHSVYTLTPGIPGDSGSGFLNRRGRAFGVLSTLTVLPRPASNGVSDLRLALAYMRAKTDAFDAVRLSPGTEPFRGPLLPIGS